MEPTLEQALRQILLSFPAVTDLVGQRIRPDLLDRGDDVPAILIQVENELIHDDLDGRGGLITATVNVEVLHFTRLGSRELEQAIRTNNNDPGTGLQGYRGQVGPFFIDCASLQRRQPSIYARETDEDRNWYGIACSYAVDYREIA